MRFRKFPKVLRPRFKIAEPVFFGGFQPRSGKGIYIPGMITGCSDTRRTSVRTTALSHSIVIFGKDINALGWDPRVSFWRNLGLWRPVLFFFPLFFGANFYNLEREKKKKKKLQRDFGGEGEHGSNLSQKYKEKKNEGRHIYLEDSF